MDDFYDNNYILMKWSFVMLIIFTFISAYFQSLIAFELISAIATLTGCLVALAAMVQQQPLAVLVAGFTMFFSGKLTLFVASLS